MKPGDLVQVLPAKIGYYIVLDRAELRNDYGGREDYWNLHPLYGTGYDHAGLMDEKFIEVVSEID